MRLVRRLLLAGWLLLIGSLLLPAVQLPVGFGPACLPAGEPACQVHRQPGNALFWGSVVPGGLLLIGMVSHELWRRICPLAFLSQLGRAVGWQRTRPGAKGQRELVLVRADSWLGRHHVQLQWSLLLAGLCLRLLLVNASPAALAVLLLGTLLAALVVGWAYGGKAWCQYICPMGPVQSVVTGLRAPLGSPAHMGSGSRVTQSMCRTIGADGREQSTCVACQVPCIDIDAERAFWQTLRGKRGLDWAWYSYPGLVLSFFLLMELMGVGAELERHPLGYLRSGAWAFDAGLQERAWLVLIPLLPLPQFLLVPLLLTAAAVLSVLLFRQLEAGLHRRYRGLGMAEPADRAILHSRLLATFLAINSFFWFADPFLGALGGQAGQLLRSLVLVATAIGLFRSWRRDEATYRRESASASLRRQLADLPGLEVALDGRSLAALSPQEVFTLVKALPALGHQRSLVVYGDVMADMLRQGRLDRASALLQLQELRLSLRLEETDHHQVVRTLAREQPRLLELDHLHRQMDDLRREAAAEAIERMVLAAGITVLEPERLSPVLQSQLQLLQRESGLDPHAWAELLHCFGPRGELERERLAALRASWLEEMGLLSLILELADSDPLLRPLGRAMLQRTEEVGQELDGRLAAAGLLGLPAQVPAAGSLPQAMDLLLQDPDPDTAAWVLMLARERDPERAARYLREPRTGLGDSPWLRSQRLGEPDPDREALLAIAAADLFSDLLPASVLWLARQGRLQRLEPAGLCMEKGGASDGLAVVLEGGVEVWVDDGFPIVLGAGQTVGEIGLITGNPRIATVVAGPQGALLFLLPSQAFKELLERSRCFGRPRACQAAPPAQTMAPTPGT